MLGGMSVHSVIKSGDCNYFGKLGWVRYLVQTLWLEGVFCDFWLKWMLQCLHNEVPSPEVLGKGVLASLKSYLLFWQQPVGEQSGWD